MKIKVCDMRGHRLWSVPEQNGASDFDNDFFVYYSRCIVKNNKQLLLIHGSEVSDEDLRKGAANALDGLRGMPDSL